MRRLVRIRAGEQEGAQDAAHLGVIHAGSGTAQVLHNRATVVDGLVLLSVVADLEAMALDDLAGVGSLDTGEEPEQSGLAGAVEAQNNHATAAVDGQIDAREDLERAVGL